MPVQEQTPLEQAAWLTEVTGNNFLLKREDLQPVSPVRECEYILQDVETYKFQPHLNATKHLFKWAVQPPR